MKSNQTWVLAATLVLTVPLLVMVAPTAEGATTTRLLTITSALAKPKVAFGAFDGNPPKLFDINGDGTLEIIAQNDNQWVYVFNSRTGAILAQMRTTLPAGWGARSFNGPEVAVMSDGTAPRLIVMNSAATVTMYRFDKAGSTASLFTFHKVWERRLTECYANPGSDSKPTLADLDNNGRLDIVLTTEERGVYALRDDGTKLWHNCVGGGNAEATVADLNRDGKQDVVHVSDAGIVSALNGQTGSYLWTFNVHSRLNLGSGSIPVGAAVAQLDGVGGPDIVFGARDSHDTNNWANDHAALVALSSGGSLLWAKQDPSAAPLTYTHPIITDAQNDGASEVYWADWNTIGHKPPDDEALSWKVQGPGYAYRYDKSGTLVWKTRLDAFWQNKDIAMADVDADGVQEVLANGANSGRDGIWYLDSRTGAKERHIETYPYQVMRGPIIGDLYRNGRMQFVVEVGGAPGPGIMVFDTQAPWSAKWPHLPYVSKTAGNEPGPLPTLTTPTTVPQTGGLFGATFTIKSPNQYWQQVAVAPDTTRSLSSVKIRLNTGAWQPMAAHPTWGANGEWTSSYNAPKGTRVEFLATDTAGATSQSAAFSWLDGTFVRRSVTSTSTVFTATFTPKAVGNNWWVETDVAASAPIKQVQVSVNGGTWTALEHQPWGSWAEGMYVPDGSKLRFRATDFAGHAVNSALYTWP